MHWEWWKRRLRNRIRRLDDFRKAVALEPNSSEAHLNLGIVLADQYQLDKALEEFTTAEKLAPEGAAPRYNRGRLLADLEPLRGSAAGAKLACERSPKFARFVLFIGPWLIRSSGNYSEAVSAFPDVFAALDPHNADAYFLTGSGFAKAGARTTKRLRLGRNLWRLTRNQTEALYNLWRALAKKNSPEAAVYEERFKRAQKENQMTTQAGQLGNFALAAANRGDYQGAISQFEQALKECGDCRIAGRPFKDLGLIECKSGDIQHGQEHLLTAKSLKPNDPDIEQSAGDCGK